MTEQQPGRRDELRVHQVEVEGRQRWVLKDYAGIVELADSEAILKEDHPELGARDEDGQDT